MKRNAFAMRLKPGCEKEYKKRHDEIWPELKAELRKAGVSNYSIYLDPKTNTLFAFQYVADDAADDTLAEQEDEGPHGYESGRISGKRSFN